MKNKDIVNLNTEPTNVEQRKPLKAFEVTVSIPVKTVYEMHYTVSATTLEEAKGKAIGFAKHDDMEGRAIWRENDSKRTSAGVIKAKRTSSAEYY